MDFLIHWPPGPVVATVQCQGLELQCFQYIGVMDIYFFLLIVAVVG